MSMRTLCYLFALSCPLVAANNYLQHNLVSNIAGAADNTDANLNGPWGIAYSPNGPFWVTSQMGSQASIYSSSGAQAASPATTPPQPTGIVALDTPGSFLICGANGTISQWSGSSAVVKIDHSANGGSYTGIARATNAAGPVFYAVNIHSGTIEGYNLDYTPLVPPSSFLDANLPTGYVPFNIWNNGGNKLYVTFVLRNSATFTTPLTGAGMGYVDLFDANGALVQRVAGGGVLNAPYGLAIAPPKFGDFAGDLLVGNFGDGTINVFGITDGRSLGTLANVSGQPLTISGLRSLTVGSGTGAGDANAIYFTAGTSQSIFGSLQAAPVIANNGVLNGASFQLGAAPYTFISILGNNLAATTRSWQGPDFVNNQLPRSLDGVSVTINGASAYIAYVSPTQLNVLTPAAAAPGNLQIVNNGLSGAATPVQFLQLSPAFFVLGSSGYAAATHNNGSLIAPNGTFPGSTPATAGEIITIYGNGFGATNPTLPDGALISSPLSLITQPTITIGGMSAQVVFGGVVAAGLYQFNVVVPAVGTGSVIPLVAQVGSATAPTVNIAIQ
jgi:uncharacterized protein (TIGR03118 family)